MRTHGTNACYAAGCRRSECRAAHNAYQRETRRTGYAPRRVDAEPFVTVLRELTLPAFSLDEVARLSGVDASTLSHIRNGTRARLHAETANKLRAVLPTLLPSEQAESA